MARVGLVVVQRELAGGRVGSGGAASTRDSRGLCLREAGSEAAVATVVGGWIGRGSRGGGSGAGWVDRQGKIPRGIWKAAAGDGTHLLDFRVRLEFDLYIAKRLSLGALGPSDLNRTVANKIARESN